MKMVILSLLMVVFLSNAFSQSMYGINFKIYQTKGDFNENVEATPAGLSFNYLYAIKDRFTVGVELGIAMYANNQYEYQTTMGTVLVDEEDCFWTAHADFRYYFYREPAIKLYAQGRMGLTTFFSSRTPVTVTPEIQESFEFHGTAFNMGLGGGLLLNFGHLVGKRASLVNLDLGVAWHSGSNASYRYMQEGSQSTALDDGVYQSVTNYVDYRVGFLMVPAWKRNPR